MVQEIPYYIYVIIYRLILERYFENKTIFLPSCPGQAGGILESRVGVDVFNEKR